jgi:hypothetical protein
MAGNFSHACRRIMRRAIAMSTGTFCLALAAGIGAWFIAAPAGLPGPHSLAAAFLPTAPAELQSGTPYVSGAERAHLVTVVPVSEQVLSAGREYVPPEEEEEPEPAPALLSQAPAIPPAPQLEPGDRVQATISYYYCERNSGPIGDGGGFCGAMFNGAIVHEGAAACSRAYLGQRFRIVGDPLEREYYCADTGSAVHGLHRDIWFMRSDEGNAWQEAVGRVTTIEILP